MSSSQCASTPPSPSLNKQMYDAIAELARANDQLSIHRTRVETARREETTALNNVNDAQKRIDALVAEIKKQSPGGSDWRRTQAVPV
jgi:septal ring factor EnvC (AmiA/AmiB activator)